MAVKTVLLLAPILSPSRRDMSEARKAQKNLFNRGQTQVLALGLPTVGQQPLTLVATLNIRMNEVALLRSKHPDEIFVVGPKSPEMQDILRIASKYCYPGATRGRPRPKRT